MLFFVVLVIALGWAGWVWSWGRDRFVSNSGLGLPPDPFMARPPSPFAPPRTAAMARRRRREVLGALGLFVLLTFLLARAWSPMWSVQIIADVALIAYGWAVYALERPSSVADAGERLLPALSRVSLLQPVIDGGAQPQQPGPRPEEYDAWR